MSTDTSNERLELHRQLRELTERTLSPTGRYAHVLLLLAAACMGVLVLALLLTEPALPLRTQAAFGAMVVIAGCWVGYSLWALLHRRPLLHAHRVVAGYLACTFTGLFAAVTLITAAVSGAATAWLAGGMGVLMAGIAVALLVRARRQRQALRKRRDTLQRALVGE